MNKRFAGTLLAVGLVVAACGSDDDAGGASDTAAPAATDAPVESAETTAAEATTTDGSGGEPTESSAPAAGGVTGLDAAFGTDGILPVPVAAGDDDRFISVVVGPDGLVYASGFTSTGDDHAFAVSRFTTDGEIDTSFGDGGTAAVNVAEGGGGAEVARGLVIQEDGKVVVAGPFEADPSADGAAAEDLDVAVVRLEADGALDATFGEGGIARIDLGAGREIDDDTYITDNAWGLTARDGGYAAFAVTPSQETDRTDVDFAVVGLTTDGTLDSGFGTDGVVVVDLGGSFDSARNIGTQADGKILATGYSGDGDGVVSPVLIRMSADGVLDETFGEGGVANHVVLDGVTESYNFAVQGENYILAGYGRGADTEEKVDLVVYRFLADGSLDTSFGTDGVTRLDLAGEDDRARNVTVLPDGNILAVGSGKLDGSNIDGMVVLLDADGSFIETFGDGGHVLVDLGGPGDGLFGVDVADDGSMAFLAGFSGADPEGDANDDSVLARIAL